MLFSCINLQTKLQDKIIFTGISFSLLPGAIYLLKGPNGSGKSTLLKTLAKLITPSEGKILSAPTIGYLGHNNAIKNDLTVLENLSLWAKLNQKELLIFPAITQFKLSQFIDSKCAHLSSGILKRVALARMIISNSVLWLLDEPETNLDAETLESFLKLLQVKISNGGMAIIASHNLEIYKKIPVLNIEDFRNEQ